MIHNDLDFIMNDEIGMFFVLDYNTERMEKGKFTFKRGSGINFSLNSKLPVQTLHYKYPKDMYIISFDDDIKIFDVRDSIIYDVGNETILPKVIDKPLYNTFGHKLKVKNLQEFYEMMEYYKLYSSGKITEKDFVNRYFIFDDEEEKMQFIGFVVSIFYKIFNNKRLLNKFKNHIRDRFKNLNFEEDMNKYYEWVNNENILPRKEFEMLKKELNNL